MQEKLEEEIKKQLKHIRAGHVKAWTEEKFIDFIRTTVIPEAMAQRCEEIEAVVGNVVEAENRGYKQGRKDECSRWMYQTANEHDTKILSKALREFAEEVRLENISPDTPWIIEQMAAYQQAVSESNHKIDAALAKRIKE